MNAPRASQGEAVSDDDSDAGDGPRFPWTVRVAGVIWAGVGTVIGVGMLAIAAFEFLATPSPCPCFCAAFGLVSIGNIVAIGLRTSLGKSPDTLASGIGSVGVALVLLAVAAPPVTGQPSLVMEARLTLAGFGVALSAAGVLALGGRGQYLAWKADHDAAANESAADDDWPAPGAG